MNKKVRKDESPVGVIEKKLDRDVVTSALALFSTMKEKLMSQSVAFPVTKLPKE